MAIPEVDLGNLSDMEFEVISHVLQRDRILRTAEENRLLQAKMELQSLRKRGALRQGCDASRSCARCTVELGRLINRGAPCTVCRKKVCKACRQYGDLEKYWVCVVCQKQMELKAISGEWMQEFCRRPSKRRIRRVPAGDVLRKAIHESRRRGLLNAQQNRPPVSETRKEVQTAQEPKEEVGTANRNAYPTAIPQFLDIRKHLKPESPLVQEIRKQLKKLEIQPQQHSALKRSESQPVLDEGAPSPKPSPIFPRASELTLVRGIQKRFKHPEVASINAEPKPSPLLESRRFSKSVDTLASISKNYQLAEEMERKKASWKPSRLDNSSSSGCPSPEGCRTPTPHDEDALHSPKRNSSPLTRQKAFREMDLAYSTSPKTVHLKLKPEHPCSGSVSSVSESEIEKSTGVIFRKVTLKKRRSAGEEKRERALSDEPESPTYTGCDTNNPFFYDFPHPLDPLFPGDGVTLTFADTQLVGTEDQKCCDAPEYYRLVYVEATDSEPEDFSPPGKLFKVTSRLCRYEDTIYVEDSDWEIVSDSETEIVCARGEKNIYENVELSHQVFQVSHSHEATNRDEITALFDNVAFDSPVDNAIWLRANGLILSGSDDDELADDFKSEIFDSEVKISGTVESDAVEETEQNCDLAVQNYIIPLIDVAENTADNLPLPVLNLDGCSGTVARRLALPAGNQPTCDVGSVGSVAPSDKASVNNEEAKIKPVPSGVCETLADSNMPCAQEVDFAMGGQTELQENTRESCKQQCAVCVEFNDQTSTVQETKPVVCCRRVEKLVMAECSHLEQENETLSSGEELDKLESDTDSQDTVIEGESYKRMKSLALKEKILLANEQLSKDCYSEEPNENQLEANLESDLLEENGDPYSQQNCEMKSDLMNSVHESPSYLERVNNKKASCCIKDCLILSDSYLNRNGDDLRVYNLDSVSGMPELVSCDACHVSDTTSEKKQFCANVSLEEASDDTLCIKNNDSSSDDDSFATESSSDEFVYSSYAVNSFSIQPLPHVLHTITEESCEESEKCSGQTTPTKLVQTDIAYKENCEIKEEGEKSVSCPQDDMEVIDSLSETSGSTCSENKENSKDNTRTLAFTRLEKYFSSGLTEAGHYCYPDDGEVTDESGGISSDEEGFVSNRARTDSLSSIGTDISDAGNTHNNRIDISNQNQTKPVVGKVETKIEQLPSEISKTTSGTESGFVCDNSYNISLLDNNLRNFDKEGVVKDVCKLFTGLFIPHQSGEAVASQNSAIKQLSESKPGNLAAYDSTISTTFNASTSHSSDCPIEPTLDSIKPASAFSESNSISSEKVSDDSMGSWKLLELQIAKLMQTVSPISLSADEPSSSSCSSTIGSNNSDYGSDTLESGEESNEETTISECKSTEMNAEGLGNTISEETLHICKQLMASLKKITSESIFDTSGHCQNQESDMIHARQYIRNQIVALMHTVNSRNNSPLCERRSELDKLRDNDELLSNISDPPDSCSDLESPKPMKRKNSLIKSKTPSESGSETTISASISIPSFDDSDNTPTESEISHEMDELFALLESSSGTIPEPLVISKSSHVDVPVVDEGVSFSSSDTLLDLMDNSKHSTSNLTEQIILERDHTNNEKCNNFLLYLDKNYDRGDYCKDQVPIWRDFLCDSVNSGEKKDQNIEVTFVSSADPPESTLLVSSSEANCSSNEVLEASVEITPSLNVSDSGIDSITNSYVDKNTPPSPSEKNVEKCTTQIIIESNNCWESPEGSSYTSSFDISRQSFESVREISLSEMNKSYCDESREKNISVSLNTKEKACSENDLLAVNYRTTPKTSKVLATKSTGNIYELDTGSNKSGFRDTGYYSFKSSEESVLSFEDSPASPVSSASLTLYKSLTSTETIPEVEEESVTSKPVTSMSLSSGNIPSEVCISSTSRSSTLPLSVRSKLYMQPPSAARPRPFASSFFSTSGVLRKLTALRDESSLSHRSLSHSRLRARGRSLSGGSDDSKHDGMTVPQISVSDCGDTARVNSGTSSDKDSVGVQEDEADPVFSYHSRSQVSLSSFVARSESMVSIYSDAGGGRYGTVVVSGEVLFGLNYNYKTSTMEVHVKECRNLAAVKPVGSKRNRSDPYVKVYLLPDRTKSGKRKTKVKKHTLNPNFDEVLKFQVTISELETRTLWLSVWHSDIFGRNDFLGEVMLPLGHEIFENPGLRWYPLQERMESLDSHVTYKGDLILALKYVPPDVTMHKPTKRSGGPAKGSLHVLVKEARNLMAVRSNGTSDPFCKSYLLPDKSKSGKQKTQVMKKTCNPKWNHTFVYEDVSIEELHDRCLELTIWDYDKITSNDFLGGVRLNLGTGKYEGRDVEWMDSQGEEAAVWHSMLDKPNMWIDCSLLLRSSMQSRRL